MKWASEFQVNTTTANNQLEPTITALADGRFVQERQADLRQERRRQGRAVKFAVIAEGLDLSKADFFMI